MAKFGIIVFPGSNCDHDCYHVMKHVFDQRCEYVWHDSGALDRFDCLIVPGGFSYGDYLRTGAIASFSNIMGAVKNFAKAGKLVIGICNGFQILVEADLLPGAFIKNQSTKFICKWVNVRIENNTSPFTHMFNKGDVLRIPIAHAEGNYYADPGDAGHLERNSMIAFRYCDREGRVNPESNPNGSVQNIAGILNSKGNILGMMPHPERCSEELLGGNDGRLIFESIISWLRRHNRVRDAKADDSI